MIKITDTVRELLFSSETALTALSQGYLNLSAYAKLIQPRVEALAKKPVRTGSIVVALSRLSKEVKSLKPLLPQVSIENISVKSSLVEIAFDKTQAIKGRLQRIYEEKLFSAADFFAVTHGIGEISIVVPQSLKKQVLNLCKGQKPKLVRANLSSLTIRYGQQHIDIPNTFYYFIKCLAIKRINIVEIISTYTEITFLLDDNDLDLAFSLTAKLINPSYTKHA